MTASLAADCGRCVGLCCMAPAFVASADFAFSKPAGVACRHLEGDARCGIHPGLLTAGMRGCVAYDCFGAGQRVVALLGPARTPALLHAYEIVRQLHELLWYATDVLSRPAAEPVHAPLAAARDRIERLVTEVGDDVDPAAERATVAPLLRRASALVRGHGRRPGPDLAGQDLAGQDLAGQDLHGADLRAADLSTTLLVGADLRGADLRAADLLAADLRGADLRGATLTTALYLTRTQLGGAHGSPTTALPGRLPHPPHWPTA